jgi:hypothetical protein
MSDRGFKRHRGVIPTTEVKPPRPDDWVGNERGSSVGSCHVRETRVFVTNESDAGRNRPRSLPSRADRPNIDRNCQTET